MCRPNWLLVYQIALLRKIQKRKKHFLCSEKDQERSPRSQEIPSRFLLALRLKPESYYRLIFEWDKYEKNPARKGVPAFINSLYQIVDDKENNKLIYWSGDGDAFYIRQPDRFAQEVLGKWFKHNNYSSFVRQLNNYGFHKENHLPAGVSYINDTHEYHRYTHSNFRQNRRDLLGQIQRKSPMAPDVQSSEIRESSQQVSVPNVIPAGDISEGRLLETILLRVDTLERRQTELEADNKSLRDDLRRHIQRNDQPVPDRLIQPPQGRASCQPAAKIVSAGDTPRDRSLEATVLRVILERNIKNFQTDMAEVCDELRALTLAVHEQQESLRLLLAGLSRLPQWISLGDKKEQ